MSVFKKKKDLEIEINESLLRLAGIRSHSRPGLSDCDEGSLTEEEIDAFEAAQAKESEDFEKELFSEESLRLAGLGNRRAGFEPLTEETSEEAAEESDEDKTEA